MNSITHAHVITRKHLIENRAGKGWSDDRGPEWRSKGEKSTQATIFVNVNDIDHPVCYQRAIDSR